MIHFITQRYNFISFFSFFFRLHSAQQIIFSFEVICKKVSWTMRNRKQFTSKAFEADGSKHCWFSGPVPSIDIASLLMIIYQGTQRNSSRQKAKIKHLLANTCAKESLRSFKIWRSEIEEICNVNKRANVRFSFFESVCDGSIKARNEFWCQRKLIRWRLLTCVGIFGEMMICKFYAC